MLHPHPIIVVIASIVVLPVLVDVWIDVQEVAVLAVLVVRIALNDLTIIQLKW